MHTGRPVLKICPVARFPNSGQALTLNPIDHPLPRRRIGRATSKNFLISDEVQYRLT